MRVVQNTVSSFQNDLSKENDVCLNYLKDLYKTLLFCNEIDSRSLIA
jgi:hypothetical protein